MRKWQALEAELRDLAPEGSPARDERAACQLVLDKAEMDYLCDFMASHPAEWARWIERALIVCSDYIPF